MTEREHLRENERGERTASERRSRLRDRYGAIATSSTTCCDDTGESACGGDGASDVTSGETITQSLGYSTDEIESVASGANLSLGCGNPMTITSLDEGETVLDLGSGGGYDCFLASNAVGATGQVIGVDMTPAMVETARENIQKNGVSNVEFRLGEIEYLPVRDESVDVIISNCVINLSPEKAQVFREAFRVLNPGGRLAIADIVQTAPFPPDIQRDPALDTGCVTGATEISTIESMLEEAGFVDITIEPKDESEEFIQHWDHTRDLSEYIVSATIEARKPAS